MLEWEEERNIWRRRGRRKIIRTGMMMMMSLLLQLLLQPMMRWVSPSVFPSSSAPGSVASHSSLYFSFSFLSQKSSSCRLCSIVSVFPSCFFCWRMNLSFLWKFRGREKSFLSPEYQWRNEGDEARRGEMKTPSCEPRALMHEKFRVRTRGVSLVLFFFWLRVFIHSFLSLFPIHPSLSAEEDLLKKIQLWEEKMLMREMYVCGGKRTFVMQQRRWWWWLQCLCVRNPHIMK